jgi:hypothetical protein
MDTLPEKYTDIANLVQKAVQAEDFDPFTCAIEFKVPDIG